MRTIAMPAKPIFLAAMLTALAAGGASAAAYLPAANQPDATKILPVFPALGTKLSNYEVDVYNKTRKYENSTSKAERDRWALAISDNNTNTSAILTDFSCAMGASLTSKNVSHVATILSKARDDVHDVVEPAKEFFHRTRPFVGNMQDTCVARDTVDSNQSYPSSHASLSWMFALVLSELAPDRSTELMARGRAFGESRVVCGMHWPSDVEAGRSTGAAVYAALQSSSAFQSDITAARSEIAEVRANPAPPDAKRCAIENAAAAKQPW